MAEKIDLDNEIQELTEKYKEDSDELFKELSESKLSTIKGVIDDINELIGQREQLSETLLGELEKAKMDVNETLIENQQHIKLNPELIKERLELRKKLIDLEEDKIQEKVNSWRDIALLKRELRERIKEFKEKKTSIGLIDKILT